MHSGAFQTLREVVRFYRRPPRNPNVGRQEVDPLVRQLRRPGRAVDELVEFLNALNDDSFDKSIPSRVPSGLNPGGRIQ
jgi:cytochrome c peroxidase